MEKEGRRVREGRRKSSGESSSSESEEEPMSRVVADREGRADIVGGSGAN